jgi:hypothetical protein
MIDLQRFTQTLKNTFCILSRNYLTVRGRSKGYRILLSSMPCSDTLQARASKRCEQAILHRASGALTAMRDN